MQAMIYFTLMCYHVDKVSFTNGNLNFYDTQNNGNLIIIHHWSYTSGEYRKCVCVCVCVCVLLSVHLSVCPDPYLSNHL